MVGPDLGPICLQSLSADDKVFGQIFLKVGGPVSCILLSRTKTETCHDPLNIDRIYDIICLDIVTSSMVLQDLAVRRNPDRLRLTP